MSEDSEGQTGNRLADEEEGGLVVCGIGQQGRA